MADDQIAQIAPPANCIDLSGRKFGYVTVIAYSHRVNGNLCWRCQCACGKEFFPQGRHLKHGKSQSCGCLRTKLAKERYTGDKKRHPFEYEAYHKALARCTSPADTSYPNYGGRGIEFRFATFSEFYSAVGPRPTPHHSLDRIDVNGHYEPGNCRWATRYDQSNNRRYNRKMTLGGETLNMAQWCARLSIAKTTVWNRKRAGWCDECALSLPANSSKCQHR